MKHRQIHINNWFVDVFIDDGGVFDIDSVLRLLYDMGASFDIMDEAEYMMQGYKPNEAFTYSNGRRHTCIYIGWTTNGAEFVNSFVHELRHLVDHISSYYGIGNGEAVGYMSGDAAFLLADDICRLGCPNCKNHIEK